MIASGKKTVDGGRELRRRPSEKLFVQRAQAARDASNTHQEKPANANKPKKSFKKRLKESWLVLGLEIIGLALFLPTAWVMWIDLEQRKEQRIATAWQLVTQKAPGNSGKKEALEYLNREELSYMTKVARHVWPNFSIPSDKHPIPLTGIDLYIPAPGEEKVGVQLNGANLSGAKLYRANLSMAFLDEADLSMADLSWTNLIETKLSQSNLSEANLVGSKLYGADLSEASLFRANLDDADLSWAYLNDADLSGASFFRAQLVGADLSGANLSGAKLGGANLSKVEFSKGLPENRAFYEEGSPPEGLPTEILEKLEVR